MEEPNDQLVFGQVETNILLSHKLFHAFNEKHHSLESHFLCLSCNGISINSEFCKKRGYSYCQICLLLLPESSLKSLCKNRSKANFDPQLNHKLLNTKYWVEDQTTFNKKQIIYLEASSYTTGRPYNFLSIDHYHLSDKDQIICNRVCQITSKHLTKHKQNFDSQKHLKMHG